MLRASTRRSLRTISNFHFTIFNFQFSRLPSFLLSSWIFQLPCQLPPNPLNFLKSLLTYRCHTLRLPFPREHEKFRPQRTGETQKPSCLQVMGWRSAPPFRHGSARLPRHIFSIPFNFFQFLPEFSGVAAIGGHPQPPPLVFKVFNFFIFLRIFVGACSQMFNFGASGMSVPACSTRAAQYGRLRRSGVQPPGYIFHSHGCIISQVILKIKS